MGGAQGICCNKITAATTKTNVLGFHNALDGAGNVLPLMVVNLSLESGQPKSLLRSERGSRVGFPAECGVLASICYLAHRPVLPTISNIVVDKTTNGKVGQSRRPSKRSGPLAKPARSECRANPAGLKLARATTRLSGKAETQAPQASVLYPKTLPG